MSLDLRILTLSIIFPACSYAGFLQPNYSLSSCVDCFNFTAPQIYEAENIAAPEAGLIVLDSATASFRGYNSLGVWTTLSREIKAPTITKFTSGSGTYVVPTNPSPYYLRIRLVGGGGGGAGSGTGIGGTGGNGGNTKFGNSAGTYFLTAGGGVGASNASTGANGGTCILNSPAVGSSWTGNGGGAGQLNSINGTYLSSGSGGGSFFGGGAQGVLDNGVGIAGATNTGGGGSGGGVPGSLVGGRTGAGGGGGCAIDALIYSPSSTYLYEVGNGGALGPLTTSGKNGGPGGSGYIEITEFYQ